jgi:pimeloyl-ACP methyl ester carboxylesterase
MRPATRYARSGSVNIAYQVLGEGPPDLAWVIGNMSNIEMVWEEPHYADFLNRLAGFSRLILFDRRGSGLSDRQAGQPTLEERMDDLVAVLDAAGSKQAALFGFSEGSTLSAFFAAAHPERVSSLILYGAPLRLVADAEHPYGMMDAEVAEGWIEGALARWGTDQGVPLFAASMVDDPRFCEWFARNARQSMSRGAVEAWYRSGFEIDVWEVLPSIGAPTLVLHRGDDVLVPSRNSPLIAERIPGARYVELTGIDHFPFVGDADAIIEEVQVLLTGTRTPARPTRRLATLLVTDLVGSTPRAAALGDTEWRRMLSAHDEATRAELALHGGREVKRTGDGFLAEFEGPARAIGCALDVAEAIERLGLEARIGVHAGECEVLGDDLAGIAVHVAARVTAFAGPGEILVSGTVRDLVAGSGIAFHEARTVELRGVEGKRDVYPVLRGGASPAQVRHAVSSSENVFRKEGEYWTAVYAGKAVLLKDSKGVRDIAQLLRRRGAEIHVLDLMVPPGRGPAASHDLDTPGPRAPEPLIDEHARAEFLRRIQQLRDELQDAESEGDQERAAKAREEMEFIEGELATAYGLGGRPRTASDPIERARKAITRRIKESIDKIEREHRALGNHLRHSINTGTFCSYSPESPTAWAT